MTDNRLEALLGFCVLAIAGAFLFVLLQGRESNANGGSYHVSALFNSAQGVSVGSSVSIAGIKIGTVTDVELTEDDYLARVTMKISDRFPLPDDSSVAIVTESLLGGYFLDVSPGGSPDYIQDGGKIFDTQGFVSLVDLFSDSFFRNR